jgi:hypothetical protein
MKLNELLSTMPIFLTNEEKQFVKKFPSVKISSLDEHNQWLVQNLVRKGVYSISKDNNTVIKTK